VEGIEGVRVMVEVVEEMNEQGAKKKVV